MRFHAATIVPLVLALCGGGCAGPHEPDFDGPEPGDELIGFMSEGELDRIVRGTAAALAESPPVQSADRAQSIAPPDWINATDLPVSRPGEFIDRYTDLLNGRVGGALQFDRRPWVAADAQLVDARRDETAVPSEPAADPPGAAPLEHDLKARLTLAPTAKDPTDERAQLALELFDATGNRVFAHAEQFDVRGVAVERAKKTEQKRQERMIEAEQRRWVSTDPRGEVRFSRDDYSKRIALSRRELRKFAGDRLEVSFRVEALRSTKLIVQATFLDESGRQVEVSRPVLVRLKKRQGALVQIVSQLPAERYILYIDRD
ncbi:hypothetical protein FBR04_21260 [Betaproteobacteria bacterium PRO7]|nr:hypothetical protein [Betaproteobacteria bacterium PRO7]